MSQLNIEQGGVPNLVVALRVIEKMVAAASRYIEDETGEAMVGLLVPGMFTNGVPTLYVLDTISPDESAIRGSHTFQQGDERQDELVWWLQENWRADREKKRNAHDPTSAHYSPKWDVPLIYLGDWHKQPGYMIQPSGGDLLTALDWLDDEDNSIDFLLTPIVTLNHPGTIHVRTHGANFVNVSQSDGTSMRVDFWLVENTFRMFLPVPPAVYPTDKLPALTPYPWHLVDEDRFETEHAQLTGDGLATSLVLWDADEAAPLEICMLAARLGSEKILVLVTPHDYPQGKPSARVAPFVHMDADDNMYDVFAEIWAKSEPVSDPPDWQWTSETYLVDYVKALETALGIEAKDVQDAAVVSQGAEVKHELADEQEEAAQEREKGDAKEDAKDVEDADELGSR